MLVDTEGYPLEPGLLYSIQLSPQGLARAKDDGHDDAGGWIWLGKFVSANEQEARFNDIGDKPGAAPVAFHTGDARYTYRAPRAQSTQPTRDASYADAGRPSEARTDLSELSAASARATAEAIRQAEEQREERGALDVARRIATKQHEQRVQGWARGDKTARLAALASTELRGEVEQMARRAPDKTAERAVLYEVMTAIVAGKTDEALATAEARLDETRMGANNPQIERYGANMRHLRTHPNEPTQPTFSSMRLLTAHLTEEDLKRAVVIMPATVGKVKLEAVLPTKSSNYVVSGAPAAECRHA